MNSSIETLEASRDFWQASAEHDKRQFLLSFAVAASGIALAGVGIKTAIGGDLSGGLLEIGVGCGLTTAFGKVGLTEVQDFADMTAKITLRQSQINGLVE